MTLSNKSKVHFFSLSLFFLISLLQRTKLTPILLNISSPFTYLTSEKPLGPFTASSIFLLHNWATTWISVITLFSSPSILLFSGNSSVLKTLSSGRSKADGLEAWLCGSLAVQLRKSDFISLNSTSPTLKWGVIHSVVFIEHLLRTRHCSRYMRFISKLNR